MAREIRLPKLNNVIISGHLTRDVELRYTPKGTAVARMSIAFNRRYQGTDGQWVEESHFLDVTAWAKTAELCSQRLTKGSPVIVEGSLTTSNYTDRDGNQRKSVEITAQKVHFIEKSGSMDDYDTPTMDQDDGKFTDDDVPF